MGRSLFLFEFLLGKLGRRYGLLSFAHAIVGAIGGKAHLALSFREFGYLLFEGSGLLFNSLDVREERPALTILDTDALSRECGQSRVRATNVLCGGSQLRF